MTQVNTADGSGLHAIAITDAVERWARRIARLWSLAAIALFGVLTVTVGIPHGPDLESWERGIQLGTVAVLVTATSLAWRWEGWGGSIMLVGAVLLGLLTALQEQPVVAFLPVVAFTVPAIGFLIAWHRTRTTASVVVLATVVAMVLFTGSVLAQEFYERGFGPAHPQSTLPGLPDTPVTWSWSGGVTDASAVVVARVATSEEASLTVFEPDGESTTYTGVRSDDVWRFNLSDLAPGTHHEYVVSVGGSPVAERSGSFTTRDSGPMSFKVAVASCARLGSSGRVFETILEMDPDLFISSGDLFYVDHARTDNHFTDAYLQTLTQPAQAALYAAVPIAYVWDDHDYGGNDSDSTSPTRQEALDAYRRNVPHYPLPATDAIYQSFSIGRVQFVLLDDRSQRDPKAEPDGPDKTMLGTKQLDWLRERLTASEDYALTVIVSQVPWIALQQDGADHWAGYAYERQVIADFIAEHGIDNILMVTGDAHLVAVDDGTNTDYSAVGNASFPLLHAAALDRPGSVKGGPFSEGMHPGGGQFGLIEVTDTGGNEITVDLAGITWEGEKLVEYSYTVSVPGSAS
ncbi:MAG: alkaline phosphatase D family protein [Acidimicrobiia bacterium]|nr:alkaline phosphatase D family protein [Acidimicrobiia bacterium]